VDEVRIKALVAALEGVDISKVLSQATAVPVAAAAVAAPAAAAAAQRPSPSRPRKRRIRKRLRRAGSRVLGPSLAEELAIRERLVFQPSFIFHRRAFR